MSDNDEICVEKVSKRVNVSYPHARGSEQCVVFFEEEPQWFRRRKLIETAHCDVCFVFVENSTDATVEDVLTASGILAERSYESLSAFAYGSASFPMMAFCSAIPPDTVAFIAPLLHQNTQNFISDATDGWLPKYGKDQLRTYLLSGETIANDLVRKLIGVGGGWSREIDHDQAEKLRSLTKNARFVKELATANLGSLDASFERIVFGEI